MSVKPEVSKPVSGSNNMLSKQLSCGAVVEIHRTDNGIKVLTFAFDSKGNKICIGRRVFTEKDLTGGQ